MRALTAAGAVLLALSLATTTARATPDTQPLRRAGQWLVDAQGRVFIGHGVNVLKKTAPYVRTSFGEADARLLADEGFTVARIGFIWAGVEPQPGHYDDAYIDRILALDDLLARYGIRTMVDVHQDMWSESTGGDGAPAWATLGQTFDDSFQDFWDDASGPGGVGIQTRFVQMWQHLAGKLASHPNVLGLDPFNEPYPGSGYPCSPFTPCPQFESTTLAAFYRRVDAAIRAGGAKQVIYPEAVAQSGAAAPALPKSGDPQTGFQYHFYCNVTQFDSRATAVTEQTPEAAACRPVEANGLGNYHAYTHGLGVPAFLGEFSCNDVNDDNAQVVDDADAAFDSWTVWAYYTAADDPGDCPGQGLLADDSKPGAEGNAKQPKLDALVVPHAQAIAGTPESTTYDRSTQAYTLKYATAPVPGVTLAGDPLTQIFIPARAYPTGYTTRVTGATTASAAGAPWLLLRSDPGATEATVTVTPAKDSKTQRPLDTGALPVTPAVARSCSSRRTMTYHLPRGARLRLITVAGHKVALHAAHGGLTVSLAGRTGTVRIRIVARLRSGRRYARTSTLHLCRPAPRR